MKPFRAAQILEWVYTHAVIDPASMSNLSAADRAVLAAEMTFLSGPTVAHQRATDGTQKLLIEWPDELRGPVDPAEAVIDPGDRLPILGGAMPYSNTARQTECVMIPSPPGWHGSPNRDSGWHGSPNRDSDPGSPSRATENPATENRAARRTACISSQVGCPVGCRFCASGLGGLDGNLSAGRIVEQVWRLRNLLGRSALRDDSSSSSSSSSRRPPLAGSRPGEPTDPPRITNVVFMGMGEPLANFQPVVHAVRTLAAGWGMGISARKITISTVGMHRAIEKLADELELPVTLALSLHAPNDALRRELIPWADFTTIDQLLAACHQWFKKTGREITLEYILLGGVNDRPAHAEELASVASKLRANINLIRYNEVEGLPYARPETEDVRRFQEILRARGVNTHIRASRGRDIAAACGQLRHETSSA
jgi:23S rRNA (adenine2503-C2)-methyltransferase